MDLSDYLVEGAPETVAMSRHTRTPMVLKPGKPGMAGQFNQGNQLQSMLSILPLLNKMRPSGEITVYPDSPSNQKPGGLGSTVRHEEVHSLLQNLFPSQSGSAPIDSETLNRLAPYIKKRDPGGDPAKEIAAYAVEKDSPLPQADKANFVQNFIQQLAKSSSRGSEIYKALAAAGQ